MSITKTRRFGLIEAIFVLLFSAIAFFSYLVVFASEESASQPIAEVSIDPQPSLLARVGVWLLGAGLIAVVVVVILKLRARAKLAKAQTHPLVNAGIPPASGTRQPEPLPVAPAPASEQPTSQPAPAQYVTQPVPQPMPAQPSVAPSAATAAPAPPQPPTSAVPAAPTPAAQPTPEQAEAHSLLENMPQAHKPGEVFHPEANQSPPGL